MKMLTRDGRKQYRLCCFIGLYLRVGELPVVVKLPTVCIGLYLRVGELPVVVKLPAARDAHGRTCVA